MKLDAEVRYDAEKNEARLRDRPAHDYLKSYLAKRGVK